VRTWFHKYLWQQLPHKWRRRMLFSLTAVLAPKIGARPLKSVEPIYVVGALRTASGLGKAARLSLAALIRAGCDVRPVDVSKLLMQDGKSLEFLGPEVGVTKGHGTMLFFMSPPTMAIVMLWLGRRRIRHKTMIGYWAWELPDMPEEWVSAFRFVHEIWAPSRFAAEAFVCHSRLPVHVVPYPVAAGLAGDSSGGRDRAPLRVLTVLDVASGFERKYPLGALEAFRLAFGDDPGWHMVIKLSDAQRDQVGYGMLREAAGKISNVEIRDELLNADEMNRLIASCDVVLSLHRSEGFGLVLAEAMLYGKVVVATNWSGNVDFLTSENSCPVNFRLVPAIDPRGAYHYPEQCWAEPDIADAARQLAGLREPGRRHEIGERAKRDAQLLLSSERFARTVTSHLGSPPSS
jgi:glycosyltransferase involved in cell wall biosynthesis